MTNCILIAALLVCACYSLQTFQEQPVQAMPDNTCKTTCNGMAEAWDSCFRKAQRTCHNGFVILEQIQSNDVVHRELSFSCK
jgi:hypothetical protein